MPLYQYQMPAKTNKFCLNPTSRGTLGLISGLQCVSPGHSPHPPPSDLLGINKCVTSFIQNIRYTTMYCNDYSFVV